MKLLVRYFLRQNMALLLMVCAVGLGAFIFIELFDRLDDFLEADVGFRIVFTYFICRLPFMLSQIFPAIFLIALVVHLGLMARNRELLALEACAVSFHTLTKAVIIYALLLCGVQFALSEFLGVRGHEAADRIWNEEVRNRQVRNRPLYNIWFRENNRIVHMGSVIPAQETGTGLEIFSLDPGAGTVQEIVRAASFTVSRGEWTLTDVTRTVPDSFSIMREDRLSIRLATPLVSFQVIDPKASLESLPLWQLGGEIRRLRDSGSNIERLLTAWHMKPAYAGAVLIMGLIALALTSLDASLYLTIPLSLLVTFCYHGMFVLCVSAGEKGLVPPFAAAWAANLFFAALAGCRLFWGRIRLTGR